MALAANAALPFHPDEAYYWLWSKKLDWGYYDHPPAVAYLLRLFSFFGDSPFAVRLASLSCLLLTFFYLWRLTAAAWDEKVANCATVFFCFLPLAHVGASFVTIDSPLFACWAMALFYGQRALENGGTLDYVLAGAALGFALLSKYTGVLLVPVLALPLLRRPSRLLSPKPWLALSLAFLVFVPVIVWNARHGWASFAFQWEHGTGSDYVLEPKAFLEFVTGYLLLVATPLTAFLAFPGMCLRGNRFANSARELIFLNLLVVLLFFGWKSLFEKMEVNWYGPAIFGTLPYAAFAVVKLGYRRSGIASLALMGILVLLVRVPEWLRVPPEANLKLRLAYYRPAVEKFMTFRTEGELLCANVWNLAAVAEYHLKTGGFSVAEGIERPGRILFHVVKGGLSSFDFWHQGFDYEGKNCLLMSDGEISEDDPLCEKLTLLEVYPTLKGNGETFPLRFYRCEGILPRRATTGFG